MKHYYYAMQLLKVYLLSSYRVPVCRSLFNPYNGKAIHGLTELLPIIT